MTLTKAQQGELDTLTARVISNLLERELYQCHVDHELLSHEYTTTNRAPIQRKVELLIAVKSNFTEIMKPKVNAYYGLKGPQE